MSSEDELSSNEDHDQHSFEDDSNESNEQNSEELERKKKELLEMEERNIKEQLKSVPFGDLLRYKQLKEEVNKSKGKQIKKDRSKREEPQEKDKNDKNASKEIKIMRRPQKKKLPEIFQSEKPKGIDPRFESYAGNFNSDLAAKTYSFIEDVQKNEINYLKKKLKNKKTNQNDREILLKNYNKVTNDMKRYENHLIERKVKNDFKKQNFNPKQRELKEQIQKAKLDLLDSRGQDKSIKKKEKKIQKQRTIERKQFVQRVHSK